jgi:uncharacterized protein (TIGR03000 family)
MLKTAARILVLSIVILVQTQSADAFGGRCGGGWGCGGWGYGGCGWGGCGYAGGWGYGGWGYGGRGYGGWGYGGYGGWGYGVPFAQGGAATQMTPAAGPDAATLAVSCPADAKLFVNDHPTTSTGTHREFVSRGLLPGASYNYRLRAEFMHNGQPVKAEKVVRLAANENVRVSISDTGEIVSAPTSLPQTTLVVHLPADAQLYLDGKLTSLKGSERKFTTRSLAQGEAWQPYAVRAVLTKNGREEVRESSIELTAGKTSEVTLDFDSPRLAGAGSRGN